MIISRAAIGLAIAAEAIALATAAAWMSAAFTVQPAQAVAVVSLIICALVAYALSGDWGATAEPLPMLPFNEQMKRDSADHRRAVAEAESLPQEASSNVFSRNRRTILTAVLFYVVVYGLLRIQFGHDFALWDLGWVPDLIRDPNKVTSAGAPALFAGIFLFAMWVRSAYRGSREIEVQNIPGELSLAFVLATIAIIMGAATSRADEVVRAGVAFYAFAVLAMACSQLSLSGATFGQLRAGGATLTLLVLAVGVTIVSVLVFGVIFSIFAEPIGAAIGRTLEVILTIILTPIAWLLEKIFDAILGDKNPFDQINPGAIRNGAQQAKDPNKQNGSGLHQFLVYGLRILALAVFIGIAWAIAVIAVRLRRRGRGVLDAASAKGASGGLGEDLRSLLRSMVPGGGWRRAGRKHSDSPTIALYMEVVEKAEAQGAHRTDDQTVAEFAPVLASTIHSPVAVDITEAFQAARYGAHETDPATLEEWRRKLRN